MDSNEIDKQLKMNYMDLVSYLQNKYGLAPCSYFCNEHCRSISSKVRRASSEGLFCHHVKEDEGYLLNKPEPARQQPFLWQQPEYLVYCNILEHLILHLKIAQEKNKTSVGFMITCYQLNDYFEGYKTNEKYLIKSYSLIENNYKDYIKILKSYMNCECVEEKTYGLLSKGFEINFSEKIQKDLNLNLTAVLEAQGMGLRNKKIKRIKKPNKKTIKFLPKKYDIDFSDYIKLFCFNN